MMPRRIQRKRTKGWRMPAGAVYVGRPTKWGNPYSGPYAVQLFREALLEGRLGVTMDDGRRELRGKNLACWCALNQTCHADVWLEVANR